MVSPHPRTIVEKQDPFLALQLAETLAEKAAFTFFSENRPTFDLVSLIQFITLGPNLKRVSSPEDLEPGAVEFIYSLIDGTVQDVDGLIFRACRAVDVRDAARAHVEALSNPAASGKRIPLCSPDLLTPQAVINNLNKHFPHLSGRVAKGGDNPSSIIPEGLVPEVVETTLHRKIFGWGFRSLEDSVVDFTTQVLEQEKNWRKEED